MKLLEDKIVAEGVAIGTDILKVDMFLNHQLDVNLLDEMGKEFYRLFKDSGATKVVTIESSGEEIMEQRLCRIDQMSSSTLNFSFKMLSFYPKAEPIAIALAFLLSLSMWL